MIWEHWRTIAARRRKMRTRGFRGVAMVSMAILSVIAAIARVRQQLTESRGSSLSLSLPCWICRPSRGRLSSKNSSMFIRLMHFTLRPRVPFWAPARLQREQFKECRCYSAIFLNRTTIFKWYVIRLGSKNIHHERSFNVRVTRDYLWPLTHQILVEV